MGGLVFLNGSFIAAPDFSLSGTSPALLYGKGVFTTIAVYNAQPFLWEKHWRRLVSGAAKLKIDISEFSDTDTFTALYDLIKKNNVSNGRARVTFFDETPSSIWPSEPTRRSSLLIIGAGTRAEPDIFRLTVSPYTVNSLSPLAGIKSCNYLDKLLAVDAARSRGFDECVMTNERGFIASAAMANIFWLTGDTLYTPALATGCLKGTTREFVLENIDCCEVEAGIEVLNEADAIFLTSAGLGVTPVAAFGERVFKKSCHSILTLIPTSQ